MHAKVDELYLLVQNLKRRHDEAAIYNYADQVLLQEGIGRAADLSLAALKEEGSQKTGLKNSASPCMLKVRPSSSRMSLFCHTRFLKRRGILFFRNTLRATA